jgi:uncharacterized phage protein gp47/JayE
MKIDDEKLNSIPDAVGFLQERNPEIPVSDPNTVEGNLALLFSEQYEKVKRLISDAELNTSPLTARGIYLDNVIANNFFVKRRGDTKAYVRVAFFGLPKTKIPKLTSVKNSFTGDIFESSEEVILNVEKIVYIKFNAKNFTNTLFIIYLNGAKLEFIAKNTLEFQTQINNIFYNNQTVILKNDGGNYVLESRNIIQTFSIDTSDNIIVMQIANNYKLIANDFGEKQAQIGAVDTLITTVSGIDKVYNFIPGIPGANKETDDEYRFRGLNSTFGRATPRAVRNAIADLEGVTSVNVINNTKKVTVDGVPPSSIAPIVAGGFDDEIAQAILDYKPGGIESWGTTKITLENDSGVLEEIGFSRAEIKQVTLKIKITPHQEESLLPSFKEDAINEIFKYANSLSVGYDVILQRISGAIVAMQGVSECQALGSLDGINFSSTVLKINKFQRAEFIKENIIFE